MDRNEQRLMAILKEGENNAQDSETAVHSDGLKPKTLTVGSRKAAKICHQICHRGKQANDRENSEEL